MASSIVCSKAVVPLLFIHCLLLLPLFVGVYCCFAIVFVLSSFAIISQGKRELVALVCSEFRVASVLWIFLAVQWVGLSHVDVALPGHTHLPFGFPVASQTNYFFELDVRFYDEQEHGSI